jgi:uncharacterized protein (TIGR03790 family)
MPSPARPSPTPFVIRHSSFDILSSFVIGHSSFPFLLLLTFSVPTIALHPDQILLLVNKNAPESLPLAQFYVNARRLPDNRILSLPLPISEEISFNDYEQQVVPAVRQFLTDNQLDSKITCIVTFFGVPLRIAPHALTDPEREELSALKTGRDRLSTDLITELSTLEKTLQQSDPTFKPQTGDDPNHLASRAESLFRAMAQRATQTPDPKSRADQVKSLVESMRRFGGPASILRLFANVPRPPGEETEQLKGLADQMQKMAAEVAAVQHLRHDPEARIRMRKLIADGFGRIELLRVMQLHIDYLEPADTTAAFDSELALLWWDYYPRSKWQLNLLHYRQNSPPNAPPTLMTMRLDAPQPGQVRDLILAGLKAERDGLKGKIVLDSRSIFSKPNTPASGGYGWYDQSIRNLADLLKTKSKIQVLHDDSPNLLPANSTTDIALYCGWYSLRNYIPPGRFNPGSVGFHVASAEMVSLHSDNERGWCRGLLNDNIAATLGPVAEPYLHAFPLADDFFPLLLTGKLPLAEVYWRTNLLTSWMINMIGDPLYTPYQSNPALKTTDLPPRLHHLFDPPATQPATQSTQPTLPPR